MQRATMILRDWERRRTMVIATKPGCHPQRVRERRIRINAEGSMTTAAPLRGITVARSQVLCILLAEPVRWRQPRSWTTRADPECAPQGRRSSRCTLAHRHV